MKKIFLFAVLIVSVNWQGQADDFEDAAIEFLEVSNTVKPSLKMMDRMLRTLSPSMIDQMHQQFTDQGKPIKRSDVVDLIQQYREQVVIRFGEELVPLMVSELRNFFSVEELTKMTQIMKTPVLQAYYEKVPDIMASAQSAGEQLGAKLGQEVMLELINKNPKFR